MKIIVTGGTGYIGSHTVVELQQAGHTVVIVDNLVNSSADALRGIAAITGVEPLFQQLDLTDRPATLRFFLRHPDARAVIHFAALKAVGESVQKPLDYYYNNLNALLNVLFAARSAGIRALLFSSSCTVYGQALHLPVTERTPRRPAESPYGNTKTICEDILRDHAAADPSFRAIALRYFNPIGAHPSALIGELPTGVPNNLIPYLTQTAAGIRPCLNVFGNDYDTPDGTPLRDYIDVVDLARAHLAALHRLADPSRQPAPADLFPLPNYEYFNVGTGRPLSVLEIIQAFERATGVRVNHRVVARRPGDIEKVWADTTLANRLLGWQAAVPIDQTLANAWRWQQRLAAR